MDDDLPYQPDTSSDGVWVMYGLRGGLDMLECAWACVRLAANVFCLESARMICGFIHGLPTANPGSWNPETGKVERCGKNCNSLAKGLGAAVSGYRKD